MSKITPIVQRLIEVNGKLDHITSQINSAKNHLAKGNVLEYEGQLKKASISLEKQALSLREISAYSFKMKNNFPAYERILDAIACEAHQIKIEKSNNQYRILFPMLLPSERNNKKTMLTEPLNRALKVYNKSNKIEKLDSAVFVFINHVAYDLSSQMVRDNDNYEYKTVLNSIAFWFLPDDNANCCDMFLTTKKDERSYSEVIILPKNEFPNLYNSL